MEQHVCVPWSCCQVKETDGFFRGSDTPGEAAKAFGWPANKGVSCSRAVSKFYFFSIVLSQSVTAVFVKLFPLFYLFIIIY